MSLLPWKKNDHLRDLSEYIDGQLDSQRSLNLSEQLVFDHQLRQSMSEYVRTDELVGNALTPTSLPDAESFANALITELDNPETPPPKQRRIQPVLWASFGLLVTAGITFAGLKRRGVV